MIKRLDSLRDTDAIAVTRPLRLPQTGLPESSPDDPAFFPLRGFETLRVRSPRLVILAEKL